MSIASDANQLYCAARADPAFAAEIRTEYAELSKRVMLGTASSDVTSSTVNGQTFSASVSLTEKDRWTLLGKVVAMLNVGARVSTRTRALFGYGYR